MAYRPTLLVLDAPWSGIWTTPGSVMGQEVFLRRRRVGYFLKQSPRSDSLSVPATGCTHVLVCLSLGLGAT